MAVLRALTIFVLLASSELCCASTRELEVDTGAVSAAALDAVYVQNRKFVDEVGRERYFRGVNVVYKDPPYLPAVPTFDPNLSFTEADVEFLLSLGVNLIRLGVMWPGVFPNRGIPDLAYLEKVRDIVRMCASKGVYTILEPHQDELHPRFCGEGVPDWWAKEFTTVVDFPAPVQSPFNSTPPGRALCDLHSSFSYIWTHDAARAHQTLYEKGAADFGDYWQTVARFFAGEPGVIGGELWNEPFPGDVFRDPRLRDNAFADRVNLEPFYANLTRAIRAAAPARAFAIAYEPTWPVGTQDVSPDAILPPTSGFSSLPEPDAIYAFHYYVPPCADDLEAVLDARLADAARLAAAPMASELNLNAYDPASQRAMAATLTALERRGVAYTGWQYKSYAGSLPGGTCTGCGNSFFGADGRANRFMMRALARPFASAVGGRVIRVAVDAAAREYSIEFVCGGGGGGGGGGGAAGRRTVITVPHLFERGDVDVVLGGLVRGTAAVAVARRPGGAAAPGAAYLGRSVVTVETSPAAAGETLRVLIRPAAAGPTVE